MTIRIPAALAVAVCLFGLSPRAAVQPGSTVGTSTTAPAGTSPTALRDLGSTRELAARFDADRGKVRIVLLLSPT